MKNDYIFLCLLAQLLMYITWSFFIRRKSLYFWKRNQIKRVVFISTLLAAVGFHILTISFSIVPADTRFRFFQLGGELIIKISFIMTLSVRLAYTFFIDRAKDDHVRNTSRLIDILTACLLFGVILLNLRTYVWFVEIMILPLTLFYYSFKD